MVAIADGEGVIGLAGIMGGASTEVSPETSDVLLEAAYWDPPRIRRSRRTLGMSTEASYRFERNIDRWAGDAMRRCIELVLATGGGRLADAPLDLWPEPSHPPRIFFVRARRPGARRRGPLERDRAVPGRHRRHGRLQAGRWPDRAWTCPAGGPTSCARSI